jgi:hypothetical protein
VDENIILAIERNVQIRLVFGFGKSLLVEWEDKG